MKEPITDGHWPNLVLGEAGIDECIKAGFRASGAPDTQIHDDHRKYARAVLTYDRSKFFRALQDQRDRITALETLMADIAGALRVPVDFDLTDTTKEMVRAHDTQKEFVDFLCRQFGTEGRENLTLKLGMLAGENSKFKADIAELRGVVNSNATRVNQLHREKEALLSACEQNRKNVAKLEASEAELSSANKLLTNSINSNAKTVDALQTLVNAICDVVKFPRNASLDELPGYLQTIFNK